jgi:predicted DNA-binding protein (MmcQ/YjbR family)
MNKKYWNTILLVSPVSENQLKEWIDHPYNLVAGKITTQRTSKKNIS